VRPRLEAPGEAKGGDNLPDDFEVVGRGGNTYEFVGPEPERERNLGVDSLARH
jgi:hypothetical protein